MKKILPSSSFFWRPTSKQLDAITRLGLETGAPISAEDMPTTRLGAKLLIYGLRKQVRGGL